MDVLLFIKLNTFKYTTYLKLLS